jgi:hypothetical protein
LLSLIIGCGGKVEADSATTPNIDPGVTDVNADAKITKLPASKAEEELMITDYADGWHTDERAPFYRYSESSLHENGTFTALVLDPNPALLNGAPLPNGEKLVFTEVADHGTVLNGCATGHTADFTRVTKLTHMKSGGDIVLLNVFMAKYRDSGAACWMVSGVNNPSGTCFCDPAETPSDATVATSVKATQNEVARQRETSSSKEAFAPTLWNFIDPQLTFEAGRIVKALTL